MALNFAEVEDHAEPFPHFRVSNVLSRPVAETMLDWLDTSAPWKLRIAEFYEQHEFSMLDCAPPPELAGLASGQVVDAVASEFALRLQAPKLELVNIDLHRLVAGQTIRIHNDFLGAAESHRLVVQLNRGWSAEQGGLLMLFANDAPEGVTDVMLPVHGSAFGFEISERSHHAVSTIHAGQRDTLVYTFRKAA